MSQNGRCTFCPSWCDRISSSQISMCWIAIRLRFCTFINAMEGNIKRLKGFNENIIEKFKHYKLPVCHGVTKICNFNKCSLWPKYSFRCISFDKISKGITVSFRKKQVFFLTLLRRCVKFTWSNNVFFLIFKVRQPSWVGKSKTTLN